MILRELTGGVYFAEPRGIDVLPDGNKKDMIQISTQLLKFKESEELLSI